MSDGVVKEIKEISMRDPNYLYVRVTKMSGMTNQKEVEFVTRWKEDKLDDLIKKAKELLR